MRRGLVVALLVAACSSGEDDTSAAGASGTGATATGATGSGAGPGGDCTGPGDCHDDDGCGTYSCVSGSCVGDFAPAGTVVDPGAKLGDCKRQQCDGKGNVVEVDDDDDVPNDFNPCTKDICTSGAASHSNEADGTHCGEANLHCAGGQCAGCKSGAQCPQGDTCMNAVCDKVGGMDGVCSFETASGVEVANADPTDCLHSVCDDKGQVVVVPQVEDVPVQDADTCDAEICGDRGTVLHSVLPDGTLCDGGTFCNPSTCTSGACSKAENPGDGSLTPNQVAGDCLDEVCDGSGGVKSVPSPAGTGCATGSCNGAGQCCDGLGNCV